MENKSETKLLEDSILAKAAENMKDEVYWGNYEQHYDWTWTDRPVLLPKTLDITAETMMRDWDVARKLKDIGVKKVLDVGSDTGHFLAVLNYYGIEAVGIDVNADACKRIISKGKNMAYHLGIQTLITLDINDYDCLVCMNITQAKWKDEKLKSDFIDWIGKHFNYTVLSDTSHQDRNWRKLKKIHDFNFLPIYMSTFILKVARRLGVERLINYPCMQKLYIVSK